MAWQHPGWKLRCRVGAMSFAQFTLGSSLSVYSLALFRPNRIRLAICPIQKGAVDSGIGWLRCQTLVLLTVSRFTPYGVRS
jgi:hypothetical protein